MEQVAEAEDEVSCSPHLGGRTLSVRARLVLALEEAHDLLDRVAVQRLRAARRQALARRTAVKSVRAVLAAVGGAGAAHHGDDLIREVGQVEVKLPILRGGRRSGWGAHMRTRCAR